jgi:hypothetical protein
MKALSIKVPETLSIRSTILLPLQHPPPGRRTMFLKPIYKDGRVIIHETLVSAVQKHYDNYRHCEILESLITRDS